jgi:hypothetical protein
MAFDPRQGRPLYGDGQMRSSTADRESAIEILKTGFAEGRLDQEEYEERVEQVYLSRTYGDLARLTWDLPAVTPAGLGLQRQAYPVQPAQRRVNGLATASAVCAFFPGLLSVAAVIFGLIARAQILERDERGAGLATFGIVLGGFMSLLFVLWVAI